MRPRLFVGPQLTPLEDAQQAMERSVWVAIHQGRAELRASAVHPDGAMTIGMRLPLTAPGEAPPRQVHVALQEIDGRVSGLRVDAGDEAPFSVRYQADRPAASTVTRLAAQFSSAELVQAAIRGHNPQDFSGDPLPSGDSVDSQAPTGGSQSSKRKRAQDILREVPLLPGMKPQEHFEAMLEARGEGPQRQRWSTRQMIQASGTGRSEAYRALWLRGGGSPRTAEVRAFLQTAAPEHAVEAPEQKDARFLSVLRENDRLFAQGKKWPLDSMARGADTSFNRARYLRHQYELSKLPPSPRSTAMREYVDITKPAGVKRDTKSARFLRAVDRDQALPAEQQLHFDRLTQVVGILASDAHRVLRERERRAAPDSETVKNIRAFLAATKPPKGQDGPGRQYDRAEEQNKKRRADEAWDQADMRKAAGLSDTAWARKRRALARATEAAAQDPETPESPGSPASPADPTNPP